MTSVFDDQKIKFERGKKFDIQLGGGLMEERKVAEMFMGVPFGKVEVKRESWLWQRTGNICIEYASRGEPSGLAVTEADHWWHTLCDENGEPLVSLVFPKARLRELARRAYKAKRIRENAGDDGAQSVVLISLKDIVNWLMGR